MLTTIARTRDNATHFNVSLAALQPKIAHRLRSQGGHVTKPGARVLHAFARNNHPRGVELSLRQRLLRCHDKCVRLIAVLGNEGVLPPELLQRPVLLSDFLAKCFSQGGLTAVLALEGLFVLMLEHDLEYPSFYDKLYSLITPDAFSSRHRNQLFRLVSLSLTSLRVPAYVVAGFIKRICRVLLLAPSPTYYFALPFVRQLFQRHPNCLPLIHRTDGSSDLFDGKDPFDPFEDKLDQCHAIDSTLWELCVLERHFLPAVNLMVSAYSSPAHDNAPLKFDKTYGRLFAQDITRSKADDPGVISYKAPAGGLLQAGHKEAGLAGVFVF
jgi:hypothetical protein